MICLTPAFLPTALESGYLDLRGKPWPAVVQAVEQLPAGRGEFLHVDLFGGNTVWVSVEGRQERLSQLSVLVTAAHRNGYRVLGEWKCLNWEGVKDNPAARSILEDRGVNAYRPKGEYDYVSPFAPAVQRTLLDFAEGLGKLSEPLDVLVMAYALPRSPLLASGVDSRNGYIEHASLDPIDMIEGPLNQPSLTNKTLTDYLNWRIEQSNRFLGKLVATTEQASPKTRFGFRADPYWGQRELKEKGAKLADWVPLITEKPSRFLFFDRPTVPTEVVGAMERLAYTLKVLNSPVNVWFDGGRDETTEQLKQALALQGISTEVLVRK